MINLSNLDALILSIDPSAIRQFLIRLGYSHEGGEQGVMDIFVDRKNEMIVVPSNREFYDYSRRVLNILDRFVTKQTPLDDVIASVVLPGSDIVRYRVNTVDSTWGHIRFSYCQEAIPALFTLLRSTASGVLTGRTTYTRRPENANLFANQCRFGQTEYGSFILKIFCPTNPVGIENQTGEPVGRATMRAVIENLAFLSSERSEDPSEPLPPTLNKQVAGAVRRLDPGSQLGSFADFQVKYIVGAEINSEYRQIQYERFIESTSEVEFDPFVYSRAESIANRLTKSLEYEREVLRGFITTLHKDRPALDTDQSHEITLDVKFGTSRRNLRLRLLPAQYSEAFKWQSKNLEVIVDALIDKRGRSWSVARLFNLRLANPEDSATLFD